MKLVCLSSLASGTHATNIGCHPVILSQQLPLPLSIAASFPGGHAILLLGSVLVTGDWPLSWLKVKGEIPVCWIVGHPFPFTLLVNVYRTQRTTWQLQPLLGWPSPLLCPNLLKFGFFIYFLGPITELTGGGITNASAGWNAVQSL